MSSILYHLHLNNYAFFTLKSVFFFFISLDWLLVALGLSLQSGIRLYLLLEDTFLLVPMFYGQTSLFHLHQ